MGGLRAGSLLLSMTVEPMVIFHLLHFLPRMVSEPCSSTVTWASPPPMSFCAKAGRFFIRSAMPSSPASRSSQLIFWITFFLWSMV